jgi:hypothetical protein
MNIKPEEIIVNDDDEEGEKKATPPKKSGMTAAEFQKLVTTRAMAARDHVESQLSADRATATDYYKGRLPDVDAEEIKEDRSMAVLSEVRDTVLGIMPDLMRTFFSTADGVVKYEPAPADDLMTFEKNKQDARIATAYVRDIVLDTDNPDFFSTIHDTCKDALVRKTGFLKWWWEESKKPQYSHYTGLTEEVAAMLAADDEVEIISKTARVEYPQLDEQLQSTTMMTPAPQPQQQFVVYDISIKRICDYGKIRIAGVPCENMIVSDSARSVSDTPLIGFVEEWTAGDFVAANLVDSIDELEDGDTDKTISESEEAQARRDPKEITVDDDETSEDPSMRKVLYAELYIKADYDGDDIPELRKVITYGTRFKVLSNEPWDEVDYAALCPIPEAHTFFGESVADLTMDIQRIKSRILRDTLDSLAQSVKPQTAVVEGQVNLDDVLNPDTSNVVRMRAPGMVTPLTIPFVGKESLPVLDFMTNVRENRTGMSDAAAGLNPKDLQSADADAVANTLSKGAARIELMARIFVETGMKPLFRGILRLLQKHQAQPRVVELFGKPMTVDPRHWDAGMHVKPTLVLGRGTSAAQIGLLTAVASKQEQLLQQLGPKNPLVTIDQYRYTLAQILSLGGYQNADSFFTDPGKLSPEERQQLEQAMMAAMAAAAGGGKSAGPAAPDPAIEKAKIESAEKIKMAELQQKQTEMEIEAQLKSAEIQSRMEVEIIKAQLSAQTTMDVEQLRAMVKDASDRLAAATKIAVEKIKPRGGSDNGGSRKPSSD